MMTPRGFYSAVQKRDDLPDRVTVRARVKRDLDNLKDLLPDAKPYQEDRWSDYPWRINVPVADWSRACALMALEIDYSNFKDEVKRKQGAKRASVYGTVWATLLRLETGAKRVWTGRGTTSSLFDDDLYDLPGDRLDDAFTTRQRLDDEARSDRAKIAATPVKRTGKKRSNGKGRRR